MAKDSKPCSSKQCGGRSTRHDVTLVKKRNGGVAHKWVCTCCGKTSYE